VLDDEPSSIKMTRRLRRSDEILEACLTLADRDEPLTAKKMIDVEQQLEEILRTMMRSTSSRELLIDVTA
jgi:hypothetical protein